MKYLAIYSGYQNWSRRNIERGIVFTTIEELEAWMATTTTYCNTGWPCLALNDNSRQKVEAYMDGTHETPLYFKTTGCGSWEIGLTTTDCDTFEEYKQKRDEAASQKAHAREQKRLGELCEQRKGWYHVHLDIKLYVFSNRGNDYIADTAFEGEIVADSGSDAYEKAVNHICSAPEEVIKYRGNASLQSWADLTSSGYEFEFLGVKTDEGYSVEKWQEWKANGVI